MEYEDFKNNDYLENMVRELNMNGAGVIWEPSMNLSTGDEAIRCGH